MSDEKKWSEMVNESRGAIEDFNDFSDDRAIMYAADKLRNLEAQLAAIRAVYEKCQDAYASGKHFTSLQTLKKDLETILGDHK